jgi:hypothetical protein
MSPLWCPWVECSARVPAVQGTKQKQNCRKTPAQHGRAESGICSFSAAARSTSASLQQATVALERAWQCHGGLSEKMGVLEDELRRGNTDTRRALAALVPCAALRARYAMRTLPRARLCIEMCPDISCELARAMLKFCPREDSFVTFLRACMPTLNNYKKIHREISWPPDQAASLRRLLCCCLPTLLALYPSAGCKDVGTPVRVALFWEMRALAMATHAARVAFFSRHKVVLRLCLVEYTFYYLRTMPVHAYFVRNDKAQFLSMQASAVNMGRNFRVELNTMLQGAGPLHVPWDALSATAKVLYDRYVRLSKSALSEPRGNQGERAVFRAAVGRRGLLGSAYQRHQQVLGDIPGTASFQVAEMFFRRAGVHVNEIAMLWEGLYSVHLQELPACVLRAQLAALFRTCGGSERLMHKYSNILLCRFCLLQGVTTSFRFDSLRGEYTCNRCELHRSVVNVCMLGRIAWVRNIPLVLCTNCCKIVVYSGAGHELNAPVSTSKAVPALACAHSHICWHENINLNLLSSLVQNCSFMQFILGNVTQSPRPWPYIEFNPDYSVAGYLKGVGTAPVRRCALCRSTTIYSKNLLLDPHARGLVHVQTCYKHSVSKAQERWGLYTLHDFVRISSVQLAKG